MTWIMIAALLGLAGAVWAQPTHYTVEPCVPNSFCEFKSQTIVLTPVVQNARLRWCPVAGTFDSPDQILDWGFYECDINDHAGNDCTLLSGGRTVGGPHFDRDGNPLTCFGRLVVPEMKGTQRRIMWAGSHNSLTPVEVDFVFTAN